MEKAATVTSPKQNTWKASAQVQAYPKEKKGEPMKELWLPHSQKVVQEREKLALTLGVLVLGYGKTNMEKPLETLREMSETFRTRKWSPIPVA